MTCRTSPSCPDTSHGQVTEPCARCGCGRRTHHAVYTADGGVVYPCRGHHLSGGHSGSVQQCGCAEFEPRIVHCEHPSMPDGEPECCCCALNPCDEAMEKRADIFVEHVRAQNEPGAIHHERAIRYVLTHGKREGVPF